MGIYDRAKDACKATGISIQAVERLAGLGNGAISKWNGATPRSDALFAVARILRVSPYWLLYGEDQPDGNASEIVALAGSPSAEYLQRLRDDPNIRLMFDLASGNYFIRLRLGGEDIGVTCATAKECRRQAQLIKAEHLAGRRAVQRSELTLRQACERYIAKKEKAMRSPETIRGYDIIMRNRFQSVMDRPVSAVTDWQKVYDDDAAHLSPKTMENTWRFIRSACRDVCGIDLPEVMTLTPKRTEHLFLEPEEIKVFVAEAAKDKKYAIPLMLCLLSCRSSEVQGLSWNDVDLIGGRIHIAGAMVQNKDREYVFKEENKTEESSRYVPILIPQLRAALEAVPVKIGKVVKERPNSVYRRANQICERLGLPAVGQHGLRHSYASLCFFLNVPIKATCATGGWKNDKIVTDIYTHLSKKYIDSQLSKMLAFFQNGNENGNDYEEAAWLGASLDAWRGFDSPRLHQKARKPPGLMAGRFSRNHAVCGALGAENMLTTEKVYLPFRKPF